jgi:N-methylhydantoinase A
MTSSTAPAAAAVDIGGTFTDVVCVDESGALKIDKLLTTLPDQGEGAVTGLLTALDELSGLELVKPGTTAVINAILERKGARVALVTTEGFRDVIEIGRGNRVRSYDVFYRHPEPFVPRHLRFEVPGRISADGSVLSPVDEEALVELVERLRATDVKAVAVSFMNSYIEPAHEEEVASVLRDALDGVFVTTGSDLSREWREFERTSTAVLNAYVGPMATTYLSSLRSRLDGAGFAGTLNLMQSNGGVFSAADAQRQPIMMLESGPVAGIIGAAELGTAHGYSDVLAFDMGGTTAKAAVVVGGTPDIDTTYYVGGYENGYPLQIPVVDVVEIGTGGGSIAWIDEVGGLRVGPHSAGSVPGPACYGGGGTVPTVTDANLLLGRLDAESFLGGKMPLKTDLAETAMASDAYKELGLDPIRLAEGIVRIATLAMANALRRVTVERGWDPRGFVMVAYGGAGPLHAMDLAKELGVKRVLIPAMPGHFSAWGMLQAPLRRDFARSKLVRLDDESAAERLRGVRDTLWEDAEAWIATLKTRPEGEYVAEARYSGQEHTIRLKVDIDDLDLEALSASFHVGYEERYGHSSPGEVVEIVALRLVLSVDFDAPIPEAISLYADGSGNPPTSRPMYTDGLGWRDLTVYSRANLGVGSVVDGPCIIEEHASTTIVDSDTTVTVLDDGTLLLEIGDGV